MHSSVGSLSNPWPKLVGRHELSAAVNRPAALELTF